MQPLPTPLSQFQEMTRLIHPSDNPVDERSNGGLYLKGNGHHMRGFHRIQVRGRQKSLEGVCYRIHEQIDRSDHRCVSSLLAIRNEWFNKCPKPKRLRCNGYGRDLTRTPEPAFDSLGCKSRPWNRGYTLAA